MTRREILRTLFASSIAAASVAAPALAGQDKKPVEQVKDPVCGMTIDKASAKGKSDYQGKTYYFCSDGCKKKFDADPKKYVEPPPPPKH
jgi:Cu+-exporting ATPase